jgi:hypothetical protein
MEKAINLSGIARDYYRHATLRHNLNSTVYSAYYRLNPDVRERDEKESEDLYHKYHDSAAYKKIIEALEKAQGRCKERTVEPEDIFKAIKDIEEELKIPKCRMDGITVDVDVFAQKFPNAYKYTAMSTHFSLKFKSGKYYLTDVFRGACRTSGNPYKLELTPESIEALVDRFKEF